MYVFVKIIPFLTFTSLSPKPHMLFSPKKIQRKAHKASRSRPNPKTKPSIAIASCSVLYQIKSRPKTFSHHQPNWDQGFSYGDRVIIFCCYRATTRGRSGHGGGESWAPQAGEEVDILVRQPVQAQARRRLGHLPSPGLHFRHRRGILVVPCSFSSLLSLSLGFDCFALVFVRFF